MPVRDEMRNTLIGTLSVRATDDRAAHSIDRKIDKHKRERACLHRLKDCPPLTGHCGDNPVNALGHEDAKDLFFHGGLALRVADHEVDLLGTKGLFHTMNQFGEE